MNKDDFGMLEVYQTSCFWGSSAVVTRLGLNTHTHTIVAIPPTMGVKPATV